MVSSVFTISLGTPARPKSTGRQSARETVPLLQDYFGDRENSLVRILVDAFLHEYRYCPLVLLGPSSVGKSHLAAGLAARWSEQHPQQPALSLTGAEFTQAYADALETDSLGAFRGRFSRAGAVVIDHLDQLAEKTSAQLELARLLDSLVDHQCRVLVTYRGEPEFPLLHPALSSRLHAGLVTPLAPPGNEARQKIITELLRHERVRVQPAAIDLLTTHAAREQTQRPTVPQLARMVRQLATDAGPAAQPWTAATIQEFLSEQAPLQDVLLRDIARIVSEHFGITLAELKGPSRRRQVVRARGLVAYLARQLTGESLESLGRFFGGRDHTTTMHACRSTGRLLATDAMLRQAATTITHRIQAAAREKS